MVRTTRMLAVAIAGLLVLAACGGDDDDNTSATQSQGNVTVGSADFPENVLLAEIYAQALEAKGYTVTKKLRIGAREAYYSQVQSGGVSVLPEYNGNLLVFADKNATAKTTADVDAALKTALPPELEVLNSAQAEDKDSLTVTQETATQNNLKTMADLAPLAPQFTVGGPPEFESRWAKTFQEVYGLNFKAYKALDVGGPLTVKALKDGDVQVANLFTTDPAIAANNFVVLEDPESVFPAQNVTPLVHKGDLNQTGIDALNAVSAQLDTPTLADLVKQVVTDLKDPDQVAKEWLTAQGLV